jgi:hypothetical protein
MMRSYFPNFSKKTHLTISFVKSAVVGAINALSLTAALAPQIPAASNHLSDVSKDVDTLFFLVIPLIFMFATYEVRESISATALATSFV